MRRRFFRLLQLPHLIRFRLTLWYTALAAVVLATCIGGIFSELSQYQTQNFNNQLISIANATFSQQVQVQLPSIADQRRLQHFSEPGTAIGFGFPDSSGLGFANPNAPNKTPYSMVFVTPTGKFLNQLPANSPLNGNDAKQTVRKAVSAVSTTAKSANNISPEISDCGKYRCVTLTLSYDNKPVVAQIAAPLARVQSQIDDVKRVLASLAAVLLAVSALGGWLLAGRALRPIDELTRRARQITEHDLSQRLNLDQEDELGRMAATFDDMILRLQQAFDRQKRFTSDASHELRTPLTVMQAELGLALARPRSAVEYRQTLESMDEEVSRLSSIVGDLLTLTRVDVDRASIHHDSVVLDEMLSSLVQGVSVIAAERAIEVKVDPLPRATVLGDGVRLRQLFTNLLDNAVNYTPNGGRVSMSMESTATDVCVTVSDTGIGIAAEHLPRIFERFYRADEAREHHIQGTGLGLAISWSIVQAHQGEIAVQSTLGQGTTFTVVLPRDSRARRPRRWSPIRALVAAAR